MARRPADGDRPAPTIREAAALIRDARAGDLPEIVRLLADDMLGAGRELVGDVVARAYVDAFARIAADPAQHLLVAERDRAVIGCLQLTVLPGLARRGATRGQIESVRIDRRLRGQNIGEQLVRAAIDRARARSCTIIQLATDRSRVDAIRFYERLGFAPSHVGMKLEL